MRKILRLFLKFSFPFFISCISTNKMMIQNESKISDFSANNLAGVYFNKIDSINNINLWDLFYTSVHFNSNEIEVDNNALVELKLNNDKNLEVNLISNNSIINSLKLKGIIENEYFSIEKNTVILPLPLFFFYKENKILLANNTKGDLLLIKGYKESGWFLIMIGGSKEISNFKFKKVN